MTKPKAIIFDLDGTLIHSAPDLQVAVNAALSGLGRGCLDLPTIISFIGNGVEKLIARSLKATGECSAEIQQTALDLFFENYDRNMTTLTRPYPGVIPALNVFRESGIPLGICTNKPTRPAIEICEQLALTRFFKVISGAEDGQAKKPDAAPLLNCISALGVSPEDVIYVGDSSIDYQTARNAGVAFRLFTQGYLNAPLPELSQDARFDHWHQHGILPG